MADSLRANFERDVEQAIVALKKGAYLLKYGRKGKPRFCPFRLSTDEKNLIWYAGREEFKLNLGIVTKIIPGQRTANFHRHPQPDKEYQSFSLIYGHDDQSLDLICKDKEQAELWFVGIKALVSGSGQSHRERVDRKNELLVSLDIASSPVAYFHKRITSGTEGASKDSFQQQNYLDTCRSYSYCGGSPHLNLDKYSSVAQTSVEHTKRYGHNSSLDESLQAIDTELRSDSAKDNALDGFRVSLSSVISCSSQGSIQDEGDALSDLYMWGEGVGGGVLGGGMRSGDLVDSKTDALVPKHLETAVMIDVQSIACGRKHAALVNKQGEVFCWGEELGGRLGHGINADVPQPQIVEALTCMKAELVACGDNHTCAVTSTGDLYTWGNDNNSLGLLGHGNDISHWVPRRIPLPQGTRVAAIVCGPWHTAFTTSSGQLFTFGDGTFGVLGHGDKAGSLVPREVMALKGLRTIAVACGVWHSAAIVEVNSGSSNAASPSGKLFTWGDSDKGCLGHAAKDSKLIPTCVSSIVDHDFCQVACGHSLTVALTTSGQVYTMGSSVYGQLGDPLAKGEKPGLVEGKLWEAFVEAIACGAHHVVALTSRTDVYTWGKGANGRLGHGDVQDRHVPTRVEALKDKHVKSIACGSSFTAAICLHKLLTGADQVVCSGCRLPFVFRRKRHNCYNCGHAFCHTCSSKKMISAKLAPNPNKPYRACNNCYVRARAAIQASQNSGMIRKKFMLQQSHDNNKKDKQERRGDKLNVLIPKVQVLEGSINLDVKSFAKQNRRCESRRVSPDPINTLPVAPNVLSMSEPNSRVVHASRYTKGLTATPCSSVKSFSVVSFHPVEGVNLALQKMTPPVAGGLTGCHDSMIIELKDANRLLNQEVMKLQNKLKILKNRCKCQEEEVRRICKEVELGKLVAGEEAAKCKAAKDVIKSLTLQLKEVVKIMPNRVDPSNPDGYEGNSKTPHYKYAMVLSESGVTIDFQKNPFQPMTIDHDADVDASPLSTPNRMLNGLLKYSFHHTKTNGKPFERQTDKKEWVEQDDPGVYITLISLPNGNNDLKRVRFSRRRFSQTQAEQWWSENRRRVYEKYNILIPQG